MSKSSMLCLDANLVVKLITGVTSPALEELVTMWRLTGQSFVAPALIGYEITNALHRMRLSGNEEFVSQKAMESFDLLSISLVEDVELHNEALDFALRFRQSAAYDAHYLAVAARYGVEFWTSDRRLHRAVEHELSWVRFVE